MSKEKITWGGRMVGKTEKVCQELFTVATRGFKKGAKSFTFRSLGKEAPNYLNRRLIMLFREAHLEVDISYGELVQWGMFPCYKATITLLGELK